MPLRDHFHSPVLQVASWEELHGQWPAVLVQRLRTILPKGYIAGPKVHVGNRFEIDIATFEKDDTPRLFESEPNSSGGVATSVWAPPQPMVAVELELPDYDEYEVRIYDAERGRQLVAAIELVSPGNLDRLEMRNAFVGKCAALLQQGVCVCLVDIVTSRQFNLYTELVTFLGLSDQRMANDPPAIYAATCRWVQRGDKAILETWAHRLAVGHPLPTLPLWLNPSLAVPLELELTYEKACYDLSIV